jgi:hypothetical protein
MSQRQVKVDLIERVRTVLLVVSGDGDVHGILSTSLAARATVRSFPFPVSLEPIQARASIHPTIEFPPCLAPMTPGCGSAPQPPDRFAVPSRSLTVFRGGSGRTYGWLAGETVAGRTIVIAVRGEGQTSPDSRTYRPRLHDGEGGVASHLRVREQAVPPAHGELGYRCATRTGTTESSLAKKCANLPAMPPKPRHLDGAEPADGLTGWRGQRVVQASPYPLCGRGCVTLGRFTGLCV